MAYWGLAHAIGPNYNKEWEIFEADERVAALKEARAALATATGLGDLPDVESAMVAALAARFPTDPEIEDFGPWNDAFAEAMRPVYSAHAGDLDVATIFAEAMMNRTPWALWDLKKGAPAEGASTAEIRTVLEAAFARDPAAWDHPGLLHLYIHLMEMSPWPELALSHGDRLVDLVPDAGHLVHMATHIDVLCGDYQSVIWRNHRAAQVDEKFAAYAGAQNFYTIYRIHNLHFEANGAMFVGRKSQALAAATRLQEILPHQTVAFLPDFFEAFWGMHACMSWCASACGTRCWPSRSPRTPHFSALPRRCCDTGVRLRWPTWGALPRRRWNARPSAPPGTQWRPHGSCSTTKPSRF